MLEGKESLSVRKVVTDNDGWSSNGSLELVEVVRVSQDVVLEKVTHDGGGGLVRGGIGRDHGWFAGQ